jgi:HSP20 family protein
MYRPADSVRTLVDIDRLIDSFFGTPASDRGIGATSKYPPVDVRETSDAYVFEASLPGYTEKDIEINVDGTTLTIESKKELEKSGKKEDGDDNYLVRERYSEYFSRSFKLPENADSSEIAAEFKNGLLALNIKKRAEAQKRVIEISSK